jgi:hypothetical protein
VSYLANDNGSGEFSRLKYGTLYIKGPNGAIANDPADHHAFTWTWLEPSNDYNAQNIGKIKIQDPDGLLLPVGTYTASQTFADHSMVTATFLVPNPTPARGGCPAPKGSPGGSGSGGSGGSGGSVTSGPPTADPPSTTSGGTTSGKPTSSTSGLADPAADPPGLPATGNDPDA